MLQFQYELNPAAGPLLATAIHRGHYVDPQVEQYMAIDEFERLREEDPYTAFFTSVAQSTLAVNTSRFEVDVNRPRDRAIYRTAGDAWGMKVWKDDVPPELWEQSLKHYDEFYNFLENNLKQFINRWGYIVVLDIHSFNSGKETRPENTAADPDINVGTRTLDRIRWGRVVDRFMQDMREFNFGERKLDVAENVRFKGGFFSEWIHKTFPGNSCVLAIELKKFFMDEVTGAVNIDEIKKLKQALETGVYGILEETGNVMS